MGHQMPMDGYGYGTIKIGEHLRAAGWDVIDMCTPRGAYDLGDGRSWWLDGRVVALCMPDWLPRIDARDGLIAFTMFEATKLPPGWAAELNRYAQAVIVPCAWNVEVFRENGVRVPIYVARWGVDPVDYPLTEPRRHGDTETPYTFLWSGTPDRRKGYDLAYRCFWRAFGHRPDVRLVLHFRKRPPGVRGVRDPNVTIVEGMFDRPVLRSMLRRADVYVFPSRGEGWGSPPREAASMGLPVIATNHGGLAEEIEHWALPLRVAGFSTAEYGCDAWEDLGEWAEPDPEHLVELFRWCFEHQDEAAAFGRAAGQWLQANAGWERTAKRVAEVVDL
jgi:glycosyltransferase involved in cell wall biosynthesis